MPDYEVFDKSVDHLTRSRYGQNAVKRHFHLLHGYICAIDGFTDWARVLYRNINRRNAFAE